MEGGQFVGRDYGGGRYDGTAIEDAAGNIILDITFHVARGMELVQGTAAQDVAYSRPLMHTFPPLFGDGIPQIIDAPPGTVTVMVKRISDEFRPAAVDGFTVDVAKRLSQ